MAYTNSSGVSVEDCFPPHEIITTTYTNLANNGTANITLTLNNNYYNNTNYSVFYSVLNPGPNPDPGSTMRSIVNGKTTTNFKFFIHNVGNTIPSTTTITIMFWVVYTNNSTTNNSTSISTTNPTSTWSDTALGSYIFEDIFSECHFTKYIVNSTMFSNQVAKGSNTTNKGWTNINYIPVVSAETTVTTTADLKECSKVNCVTCGGDTNLGKTTTNMNFYFNFDGVDRSIVDNKTYINVLLVKPPTNLIHYSSNYKHNGIGLENIHPITRIFYQGFSNTSNVVDIGITLTGNTKNYIVIPCLIYNSNGSSSTYGPYTGANTQRPCMISKSATGAVSRFYKGTGNFWNGAVSHLVIFYY